jgi:hypothetical protein
MQLGESHLKGRWRSRQVENCSDDDEDSVETELVEVSELIERELEIDSSAIPQWEYTPRNPREIQI